MQPLNGHERIRRVLSREPADRIGIFEHFWGDTMAHYQREGLIGENELPEEHFNLDIILNWAFNMTVDLDFEKEILEETDETVLIKDGNGAVLRQHKLHNTTPEHVDFSVKTRKDWEAVREQIANVDERRINFEGYRQAKAKARELGKYFMWSGINVFELLHPVTGHEYMLIGMAEDPDWILDMAKVYSDTSLQLQEILFEREGQPDGIWYYEDMGFKNRPFMSPAMYRELIYPSHKRSFDFAHERGMPVTVHCCGFIEPLLPHMVDAGMDCLQVIEIKAGMDLLRIYKEYGDRLSLMGGIDVRTLYSNDRAAIDRELETKIPIVKQGHGYCLHSDHSIPVTVEYETLKYFHEKALSL